MCKVFSLFIYLLIKSINRLSRLVIEGGVYIYIYALFNIRHVSCNMRRVHFYGKPQLNLFDGCKVSIGDGFICRSGIIGPIDTRCASKITVASNAELIIGEHSGIANTCIHCHKQIIIGHHVNIGAGTMVVDTDFHSLDWRDRADGTDIQKRKIQPVSIGDYVFIGMNSIILKGTTIGEKSIIGAGSVVSGTIPGGEIWGGNPARFLKKID